MKCTMCNKPLPKGRRSYCSNKCANRAAQVKKYGLSAEDYAILTEGGKCPICKRTVRRWNVDHDWKTNLIRGAICGTCNQRVLTAITQAEQALALYEYLSNPPASRLEGEPRKVGNMILNKPKRRWFR